MNNGICKNFDPVKTVLNYLGDKWKQNLINIQIQVGIYKI